jgi:hypothetical protein
MSTPNTPGGRTYTIGEVKDFIAAKDVDLASNAAARAKLPTAPDGTWDAQWASMQSAYESARTAADLSMDLVRVADPIALVEGDDYDGTPEYAKVAYSLNSSWASDTVAPGSFDDLVQRLTVAFSAQNITPPTPAPTPQPQNDSGVNPNAWNAYLTGLAAKLGIVNNPPPGTPGTQGAPPIIPTWLKWTAGGALGLFALDKITSIAKALK